MKTQLNQETRKEYNKDCKKILVKYWVLSYGEKVLKDVKCNSKDGKRITAIRAYYENQINEAIQIWE